jgi:hypothetical protein
MSRARTIDGDGLFWVPAAGEKWEILFSREGMMKRKKFALAERLTRPFLSWNGTKSLDYDKQCHGMFSIYRSDTDWKWPFILAISFLTGSYIVYMYVCKVVLRVCMYVTCTGKSCIYLEPLWTRNDQWKGTFPLAELVTNEIHHHVHICVDRRRESQPPSTTIHTHNHKPHLSHTLYFTFRLFY